MLEAFETREMAVKIEAAVQDLGAGGDLSVLAQGYPRTVLGPIGRLPALLKPDESWEDFSDIRIFGPMGEWHAFRLRRNAWRARAWKPGGDTRETRAAQQILWGTRAKGPAAGGWVELMEASGANVTVPEGTFKDAQHPAALELVEILDFDQHGMAGVVDVALRSVRGARK